MTDDVRIPVTVFSDAICPYCYIGKRRLDSMREGYAFDVTWVPFEIHPEVPPEGVPIEALGGARVARLRQEIARIGEEVGLTFAYPERLPNSHRALELLEHARHEGVTEDAHEIVFRAYFGEGRDIGRTDVLADLAAEMGLDPAGATEAIEAGTYKTTVDRGRELAMDSMVTAVPTFFIGKRIVWGAQPDATFEFAFARAREAIVEGDTVCESGQGNGSL